MRKKIEIRQDNAKFDLVFQDSTPEYYTDGLGQMMVGPVMSKILFYSSGGIDENGIEERNIAFHVCIPTNALFDMTREIINNTIPNRDLILTQAEVARNSLADLTAKFKEL
ncbi:hypothetical protein [Massilia sp. TN1-12]|uniref:hypothetical protein n=1 Tax=Massilia paldalensis TaxID=3377675 RepID=UPI00384DEEE9